MSIPFTEDGLIYSGKNWSVILAYDQTYLGRCIVYLKTRETEDLMSLSKEEIEELWNDILPKLSTALKNAFKADRINYAHLANAVHYVHWHIIPRFEKEPKRIFDGQNFEDPTVGNSPLLTKEKRVPKETEAKIIAEINKYLK